MLNKLVHVLQKSSAYTCYNTAAFYTFKFNENISNSLNNNKNQPKQFTYLEMTEMEDFQPFE